MFQKRSAVDSCTEGTYQPRENSFYLDKLIVTFGFFSHSCANALKHWVKSVLWEVALSAFKWKDHKEFEATESWFLPVTVRQHLAMSVKTFVTILLHFPIQITIQDWHFEISLLWRLFSESTITGTIADGRARIWRKRWHFKFRRLSVDMALTDSPRHQLLIVRCC